MTTVSMSSAREPPAAPEVGAFGSAAWREVVGSASKLASPCGSGPMPGATGGLGGAPPSVAERPI